MVTVKRKLFIMTVCIFLVSPVLAISGERSVIVGFHKKPGPSERALVRRSNGNIKKTFHLVPAMVASLTEKEIEKLRKDKNVAYIEDDALFMTASDEYISAWGVSHIGAEAVHAGTNKGAGVKIAVIDTGIDYTHDDLDGNYAGGYDFVFNDADPYDDNTKSHGTHVAGIIAAEENGTGIIGVAPEASLYAVKVLDGGGFGLASWIAEGIEWAVDNDMDIANISIQGPHMQLLQDACDAAYDAGLLVIAAGGNTNGGSVTYPAAYDSVIAVTGTDAGDLPAYFSPVGSELELAAPGLDIYSTIAVSRGSYGLLSGTSQAAPHVTGTAALFFSTNPVDVNGNGMKHDEVRDMLKISALDLGASGFDEIYGYGLVNAAAVSDGFDCPDSDGDGYAACYGICDPGVFLCGECDDSDENVNPSALEICDGIDNNCDGSTDEGFPEVGTICTAGVGACEVTGSYFCTPDQVTECDAVPGTPGTEGPAGDPACNDTIDNDCDGMTDGLDPDCGAPPVRQSIGFPDTIFNNLEADDCRACHDVPGIIGSTSNVDRHHLLYGSDLQEGECSVNSNACLSDADCDSAICSRTPAESCSVDDDCDKSHLGETCGEVCIGETVAPNPYESPGVYGCLTCHDQDTTGGGINFLVERDCLQCHIQIPGEASVHHLLPVAQGLDSPLGDPTVGDCTPCHGTVVDDIGDDHTIPTYAPSLVTPNPSGGVGLPLNSRGNGAGACNYCHDSGMDNDSGVAVFANNDNHHNTGVYRSETGVTNDDTCLWCHQINPPIPDAYDIRTCEGCHGYESLHNIQADSPNDANIGTLVVGGEDAGYGHIGADDPGLASDCWGCHGFGASSAPGYGLVIPFITAVDPAVIVAGTNPQVTINGAALTNVNGTEEYTSHILLTADDESTITLMPDAITEGALTVTIPGATEPGNYTLQAVKGDALSNPVALSVKPQVVITDVQCYKCLAAMTVTGSGFGDVPPEGTEDYLNVDENGLLLDITSWTDTMIEVYGASCSGIVGVNALFGSAIHAQ